MKAPFPFVYFITLSLLYIFALPLLLLLSLKKKYSQSIPARFFLRNFKVKNTPKFWFHACSFGECKSYAPILHLILERDPNAQILLTCITQTGFQELQRITRFAPQNFEIHYLPFEIFLPFWRFQNLQTLIVTEAELWKMLFWSAKKSQAHTILLNARISDRSLKNYQRFAYFYRGLFKLIDSVLAQQAIDAKRLQNLGATNISLFPNLKVFTQPTITKQYPKDSLVILAASTHQGEEKLILEAYLRSNSQAKLLIAPRHPERFEEVERYAKNICNASSKRFSLFSEQWGDVVLVNTLGELNNLFAISDCVILGGSFIQAGGHNPLEPAFFHNPILTGPHIYNQKALFELVENYEIIHQEELSTKLTDLHTLSKTKIKDFDCKMQDLITLIFGH
ncbi:3-deoxy-D-manno-octulosonic acid transferase [Helicobacter enhydrae]|uniref:3-deoxy-D-manno-octulosonic acid transferase n=1 Tax=Helicobacter enhydrae TaxID=222136 RepID=A0A1B1U6U4_9HELI|nr:lipid IV(A) 3-deoxy-D-manno-octulosonic acid transferase [Helicobacter enhydrae]ANV98405.1 3-deoxy-D-manno-octulosonic acid transferase [Helicobacter enhydrae]